MNGPQRGFLRAALIGDAERSTILIVDDYPAVRGALRTLVESRLDRNITPGPIILDLSMPEMNGLEAATIQKTMPQVPLFLFTFHERREVKSQAARLGIPAVFSKSTGINALVQQASGLLDPAHRARVTDDRLLVC